MRHILPLLATVTLGGTALAQVAAGNLSLELEGEEAIGLDNCATAVENEFSLSGTLENAPALANYDLRIYWTAGASACGRTDISNCQQNPAVEGKSCGCLAEVSNSTNISANSKKVSDLVPNLCASASSDFNQIIFTLEYHSEADDGGDDTDDTVTSEVEDEQTIKIDFVRPSQPETAPSVRAREEAVEVDVAELADQDVERYEVCIRPLVAAAADAGVDDPLDTPLTGADALRDGYAESDCRTLSLGDTNERIGGLTNGVTYQVVYAGIDEVGNRGPNSPAAVATPAEVLDFAELYVAANGTERGGCAASQAPQHSFWPLALLFVAGVSRRRRT